MESEIAGPQWSWITLAKIAEHGHGVDTDDEVWVGDPAEVARQMRAYWPTLVASRSERELEEFEEPPAETSRS
jgi:hypothetical protein